MVIIGVTGNSGSGKSTISTIIKNNTGALIIDADNIVKEIRVQGEKYYDEVVKLLGDGILIKNSEKNKGKIDKAKLSKLIFNDDKKREELNKLTFKYVGEKTKNLILENKDKEFIVLDFPLLFEGGFDKICNYIIGVVSDEDTKVKRLRQRDRISREYALKRLETQMSDEVLREKSNYIVENTEKTKYIELIKNVIRIIHNIKKEEENKKK